MLADGGIHARLTCEDFSTRAYGENAQPRYNLWLTGDNAARFCQLVAGHLTIDYKRDAAMFIIERSRRVLNTTTDICRAPAKSSQKRAALSPVSQRL